MRESIGIKPGDRIRCPDRPPARWHTVISVGRRKDGSRYITLRRGRLWRLLGLSPLQRLEWSFLRAVGFGVKRARKGTGEGRSLSLEAPSAPKEAL